ncbi:hypothetical protein [uncultured Friedmanniella sp.]|uniref:hypothetical protein n=1 Tax=uncultured Friedmanniella sp. TaxID=335381 RepID=UPI0035C9C053
MSKFLFMVRATAFAITLISGLHALPPGTPVEGSDAPTETQPATRCGTCGLDPSARYLKDGTGIFAGVGRTLPATPNGKKVAVWRHNAYTDSLSSEAANARATYAEIDKSLAAKADVLEIDVSYGANGPRVDHGDAAFPMALDDVLNHARFENSSAMIAIELKDHAPGTKVQLATQVLDALRSNAAFATSARPALVLSFDDDQLETSKKALAKARYDSIRPHVRFIYGVGNAKDLTVAQQQAKVTWARARRIDALDWELDRQSNLTAGMDYAKARALNVGFYHVAGDQAFPEWLAGLRESVDWMATDNSVAEVRKLITRGGHDLAFINPQQTPLSGPVPWRYQGTRGVPLRASSQGGVSNRVQLQKLGPGHTAVGTVAKFVSAENDRWNLGSLQSADGVAITAVVKFNAAAARGHRAVVVANSRSGGYSLFQSTSAGGSSWTFTFLVVINGVNHYAVQHLKKFDTRKTYILSAAWRSGQPLRLWINYDRHGVAQTSAIRGRMTPSGRPTYVGARPASGRSSGLSGYADLQLRMVNLQTW